MSVACSPEMFKAKMSELMATYEFVPTYLDDLLCISKGSLDDHIAKLQRVFIRLWNAGLNKSIHANLAFVSWKQNT